MTRRVIRGSSARTGPSSTHAIDRAVERHLVGEVDERLLQGLPAAVALHVLAVDVRDHRDRRRQLQERAIAFVRFDDHVVAAAEPRVAAEGAQPAADHRRRIEAGALEHQRHHRRRRRLAVRAGDRDAVAQPHQLGEHLGARDHRNARGAALRRPPGCPAGSPTRRRRRRRRRRAPASCPRPIAHAERRQPIGDVGRLRVRSADLVAEVREQLGDAAHADAADADEVDPSRASEHHGGARERQRAIDDHLRRVRLREPPRRRRPSAARRAGSPASAEQPRRPDARRSDPSARSAPPPRPRPAPRRSCAGGRRPRSAAEPESPPVPPPSAPRSSSRPARQTTRSAAFISRSMANRNGSTRASSPASPVARRGPVPDRALLSDA